MIPVLLLVYKRADLVKPVLDSISLYKPQKFYIAADGPKTEIDRKSCFEVRDLILSLIDWECEVFTMFRDENLGCGKAVSSAISWFFSNEESGMIIEEDCLPSPDFFNFCEIMLHYYRDDINVKHISGCNFIGDLKYNNSYFFSRKSSIWGWATWRRAWEQYDFELDSITENRFNENIVPYLSNDYNQFFYWKQILKDLKDKKIDTWDFQWQFSIWLHQGVCIYPSRNLIKNIGFHENALHTKNTLSPLSNLPLYSLLTTNLKKKQIVLNTEFDDFIFYYVHKELFDLKFRDVKKYKIELEPTILKKISNAKYSFRDKLYLIKEWLKQKNR